MTPPYSVSIEYPSSEIGFDAWYSSAVAFGVADPSRTLPPNAVCLVHRGQFVAHERVLLYRSPGIHPGDVRPAEAVLPSDELREMLYLSGAGWENALIFSTRGSRSLASEMANGDMDGDTFSVRHLRPACCS